MRIHFMGIEGSGIAGVAKLTRKMDHQVSGCDLTTGGHDLTHLKGVDLVVATPAVFYQSADHPELVEAKQKGILLTWQEFLGKQLLQDKKVIAVAGTHGKSTTTAMAGKLLVDCGFDPIVVLGASVPAWGGNSRFGKGEYAVVEADEFYDNFLNYDPDIILLTNIEFDHPDFFRDEAQVRASFRKFIARLKGRKTLITQKDSLNKHFNLKVFGEYNQQNANLVYVLGKKLGIAEDKIIRSLEGFGGIERRMELIKEKGGIRVYDDYAHHPTAIKTTLEGLREKFPRKKILAIIEPHGYKRTKALLPLYNHVFAAADGVIVGPIFRARDKIDKNVTPEKIAEISDHPNIQAAHGIEEITNHYLLITDHYDTILVMGAGKSNLWAREIAKMI